MYTLHRIHQKNIEKKWSKPYAPVLNTENEGYPVQSLISGKTFAVPDWDSQYKDV